MNEARAKIEAICKEYDLPVFENPRDNVMVILESAEPSKEDKLTAFDCYDEWLLDTNECSDDDFEPIASMVLGDGRYD